RIGARTWRRRALLARRAPGSRASSPAPEPPAPAPRSRGAGPWGPRRSPPCRDGRRRARGRSARGTRPDAVQSAPRTREPPAPGPRKEIARGGLRERLPALLVRDRQHLDEEGADVRELGIAHVAGRADAVAGGTGAQQNRSARARRRLEAR